MTISIDKFVLYHYTIMDFLLSKYMVWYLLKLTVLTKAEPRSILSNSVNIRPYLLSKMSIIVLLHSEKIYERYMCSNLWSHVQNTNRISCALLWPVVFSSQFYSLTSHYFGPFSYLLVKRTRRISQYSYLLETLIFSEYGLTISGHVTVLHQWLLEKTQTI